MPHHAMTRQEWGLLLTLALLWGGSFFFVGVAVAETPTLTIVAIRVGGAALVLWAVLAALGRTPPFRRALWAAFFVMALMNNAIPFTLIVWGQGQIASGLASILNATTPIFSVLLAHLVAEEKLTLHRGIGVVLGVAGVAVLMGWEVVSSLGDDLLAQAAIATAAFSYACGGLYGRRFKRMAVKPAGVAAGQLACSAALLVPLAFVIDGPPVLPSLPTGAALAGLAILSTALAYILYFRLLATVGPTNLLLVTLLVPVTAILLGTAVLGERLAAQHFAGFALIGLGLVALDGRLFRRRA